MTEKPTAFHVHVIETATGQIVKAMTSRTRRNAERVESGLNINLNHAEFHTEIVEE